MMPRVRVSPRARVGMAVLTAVTLSLPVLVSLISLRGSPWLPIGDEASILFRVKQVGSLETPLVGVYSTRGWAHPGPALYFLLVGPYRIYGGHPINLFMAAATVNVAGLCLACFLAWRRRGLAGVAITAAALATLLYGMRPELYVQAWNPYLPILLYFAFMLSLWCVAERDWVCLPVALVVASLIVQLHISYLPLVVGGLIAVGVLLLIRRSTPGGVLGPGRRLTRISLALVALTWIPPVIDLYFGDRNLLRIGGYFLRGEGRGLGLIEGLGILSGHLRLGGPWSGGDERVVFGNVKGQAVWPLLLLCLVLTVLAVAAQRRRNSSLAVSALALSQIGAGVLAASKVEAPVLSYLLVWMLPLAAFSWLAVLLTLLDIVLGRCRAHNAHFKNGPTIRLTMVAIALVAVVVQTSRTASVAGSPPLPRQTHVVAVESILAQLKIRVRAEDRFQVEGVGDDFNEAWVGVVYGLAARKTHFYTADGAYGQKWGTDHRRNGQHVDYVLTVATTLPGRFPDPVEICTQDSTVERIAVADELASAERDELQGL